MTTDPLDVDSVIAAGRGQAWRGVPTGTTMGHVHLHVGSLDEAEAFWSRGPAASVDEARLLEWELVVPSADDIEAAVRNVREGGFGVEQRDGGIVVADPWGTRVHIRAAS